MNEVSTCQVLCVVTLSSVGIFLGSGVRQGELTPSLPVRLVTLAFSRVYSIWSLSNDDSHFPIGLNNLAVKLS